MNDTHGELIQLQGGGSAFIDGVPDKCKHEWDGDEIYFLKDGSTVMPKDYPNLTHIQVQEKFCSEGNMITGGAVTCSKCGKPFEPPMF